ncbi:hypothetical protein [Photobacterium kishitanii]|uniref:Uncharacterized protein n=1 Tax=Photobacterium kishitanii TaxID=318456 RepID=A0A2T3KKZ2_9GAMM|nr:hypothetical protein [Photobacterium kishitanii]PSV00361.1 hypothetical protein C9J27_04335 [Photobacterium kishitanii]
MDSEQEKQLYVCFNEKNNSEGETWSRFIQTNDKMLPILLSLIDRYKELIGDDYIDEFSFDSNEDNLSLAYYTEAEAQKLVNKSNPFITYYKELDFASIKDDLFIRFFRTDEQSEIKEIGEALYKLGWMK